jgi:hypothetical protein
LVTPLLAPQQETPHAASHARLDPLASEFAWAFTWHGFRRFAEWVTALALNVLEEHTITPSVTAIERVADGKALETFAEYGAWRADYVARMALG